MRPEDLLQRLADFEPTGDPFVSLYLDARPDGQGRERIDTFVRNELPARARTYPEGSREREALDRDIARIARYLETEARPEANGIAVFACDGAGFFDAVQLPVPLIESQVVVARGPHLYPLAYVLDRYRRYAAVVLDTHTARVFVFGLGEVLGEADVQSPQTRRTDAGGWSQARYQRHVDNYHAQHVKEVIAVLDRVVREERIDRVVVAGDEVATTLLRRQLPKALEQKMVAVLRLDARTPEHEVLRRTLRAVDEQDARDDREKVGRLLDAYRAGGLGIVGREETLTALQNGQVYDLILTANLRDREQAEELIERARRTDARVTFIEDPSLLADVGGVGGLLRYRLPSARRAA